MGVRRGASAGCVLALLLGLAVSPASKSANDETEAKKQSPAPTAWTLDEALGRLAMAPRDPYLQYVALQLARRSPNAKEELDNVAREIEQLEAQGMVEERREKVDLFSLFSGALAVQESLQLDAMRGGRGSASPGDASGGASTPRKIEKVAVANLQGPGVKSHPWAQMLAGRKPVVSSLARLVPGDFYLVSARSTARLLDLLDAADLWGTHLFNQAAQDARSQNVADRVRTQLAIRTTPLLRPFYDLVVDEIAVTGSDPFLREGSDITFLFRLKQPAVFRARMDSFLAEALQSRPDAKKLTGKYLDIEYVHVATPDRAVDVYAADPEPNLHVRGNSRVAFERVLEAVRGHAADGNPARVLGNSAEFAYVRTLMPEGAQEEDVFIYLSDPFIRRLVGPTVKLTERRRMLCDNHLRMIAHAALLYRSEHVRAPQSLDDLAKANCCPGAFNDGELRCPDGGTYSLSADGSAGVCSHHGHCQFLTPCCESPVSQVNGDEADEYRAFLKAYNEYWRLYFDPIAVRIQVRPEHYRVETIILPLIDNSIYTALSHVLGGEPEPLDSLPVPRRNILSVFARFNPNAVLEYLDVGDKDVEKFGVPDLIRKGLGNTIGLHIYDAPPLIDVNLPMLLAELGAFGGRISAFGPEGMLIALLVSSLSSPVYVSVPVRDEQAVDAFLDRLDGPLMELSRKWSSRVPGDLSRYDGGVGAPPFRSYAIEFGPLKWRLYWGRIGKGLYVASKLFILQDLAAIANQGPPADPGPPAHALVRVRADHWNQVLPDFRLGWEDNSRKACLNNVGPLSSVARSLAGSQNSAKGENAADEIRRAADRLYGVRFACPDGGPYDLTPDGKSVTCSVHGSCESPKQPTAPSANSRLGKLLADFSGLSAALTFREDGLHAVAEIRRNAAAVGAGEGSKP